MICKKCGTENAEDSQFCSKCGNNLKNKKKIINNIYALLSIILFCICFFVKENIYLFILLMVSIILSIIAIIKSSKLKKEIGKRKGLTLSIIILILSLLLITFNFLMNIEENINIENNSQTESNIQITYNSLNEKEKLAYNGVKELYNNAYDEESIKINSIYCQEVNTDTSHYFTIYINYTGKNAFNGTVKNCYKYRSSSSILGSENHKDWVTGIGQKLNTEKIMQVYNSSK